MKFTFWWQPARSSPAFAFPAYDFPGHNEVLIYPRCFSREFETGGGRIAPESIEGRVGSRYMNHSLLLLIKKKMGLIKRGGSDINRYGINNHTEFSAVESKYVLSDPMQFQQKYAELYQLLTAGYHHKLVVWSFGCAPTALNPVDALMQWKSIG